MTEESHAASAGLFESLKTLSVSRVSIVHTRLELLSTDVAEERQQLTSFLVLVLVALGCLGLGVVLMTLLIVVVFWKSQPLTRRAILQPSHRLV